MMRGGRADYSTARERGEPFTGGGCSAPRLHLMTRYAEASVSPRERAAQDVEVAGSTKLHCEVGSHSLPTKTGLRKVGCRSECNAPPYNAKALR